MNHAAQYVPTSSTALEIIFDTLNLAAQRKPKLAAIRRRNIDLLTHRMESMTDEIKIRAEWTIRNLAMQDEGGL